jgi:hypothetical protein
MNNSLPCGKLVNKTVKKSVEKLCLKIVEFYKLWILKIRSVSFLTAFSTSAQKYTNNVNKFYTAKLWFANLLFVSFPRFPQTSIITITTFN